MKDNYYILKDYQDKLNPALGGLFQLTGVYGCTAEIRQGDNIYYTQLKKIKKFKLIK